MAIRRDPQICYMLRHNAASLMKICFILQLTRNFSFRVILHSSKFSKPRKLMSLQIFISLYRQFLSVLANTAKKRK